MEPSVAAIVIVAVVAMLVVGVIGVLLVIPRNAKLEIDARKQSLKIDTTDPQDRSGR